VLLFESTGPDPRPSLTVPRVGATICESWDENAATDAAACRECWQRQGPERIATHKGSSGRVRSAAEKLPKGHGAGPSVGTIPSQILGPPMIEADQLQKAIEGMHRCSARLVRSVPVKETHEGAAGVGWHRARLDLAGHPAATRIYAWSSPIVGTPDQRQFFAVLHQGQVTSPTDAARAVIARQEDIIPN
jgi:hypothetical protein